MNTKEHVYDTEYAYWEFSRHGEMQLQQRLKENNIVLNTIFDVGMNIGEWKRMVRQYQSNAYIHCFEPMPSVYKKMLTNEVLDDRMMPNPFGLSSRTGLLDVVYDEGNDRLTSAVLDLPRDNPVIKPIMVMDGDSYCAMHGVEHIDYLKIDTEGHELQVLKGLQDMVQSLSIDVIQFEYGYANILTKDMLIDFYRMLNPLGYMMGRLTPEGVHYKDYAWTDENFIGPDFVAVKYDRPDIINATQVRLSN